MKNVIKLSSELNKVKLVLGIRKLSQGMLRLTMCFLLNISILFEIQKI